MMMPRRLPVSLIAACSLNRVIGKQGRLPWQLPCDWAWFVTATQGQVLIVGRKSFEEFGEPVPNRHTIVVSPSRATTTGEKWPHVHVVASLDAAIALAHDHPRYAQSNRVFVGGGERLYQEALDRDLIESCYVTRVHQHIADGDAFLPSWTSRCPELVFNATTKASNGTSLSFGVWRKTN
ncbi:hypothetical protein Poli38472_000025 [Pythium oligandrum]|uniref:Bifunctional dihydrofolate reductase-thymidylate synthase n=1 Tax=Pythium oligandrum TaxID=41045 RepID=A0A8K1FIQ2_PYTOL|nr:hypothetical protein Poli38472_000025 [Pythium oligandrum]|eukprot:TMW59983.1 hypothetical protein Poli38472_000025 [Pythium oligandrum]